MSGSEMDGETTMAFVLFAVVGVIFAMGAYRNKVRRSSLRRRSDGVYVWTEWHGGECSSRDNPASPGGAWDSSDGCGDGGGDGGGGD